jgi:AbrB family looped-hinge helix DNA binding protein
MSNLTVGCAGEIVLPGPIRDRYGLKPNTPVRLVETRSGILLVPLTNETPSPELEAELEEWQALSRETWAMVPWEDMDE